MVLSKPEENGMIDWIDILSKNVFKRLKEGDMHLDNLCQWYLIKR